MLTKSLFDLKQDTRHKADLHKDGGVISDLELTQYINEGLGELYDLLILADDARTFTKHATKPPKVGKFSVRLPNDFYRMVSVHILRGAYYDLADKADPAEYAQLADNRHLSQMGIPKYFTRWDITTGERFLFVFPEQPGAEGEPVDTIAITYFPQPPALNLDDDKLDNPASWLEFITITAAIKCLSKIDRDSTQLHLQKKEAWKRIKKAMRDADLTRPHRIRKPYRQRRLPGYWY